MTTTTAVEKKLLKVLHVGVSNRGEWPLKHCNISTGFLPAALCDVSAEALAKARAQTNLPESACFTNYDQALQHSDADCVIICAPTILHVPLAKKAIAAGLPVLIEKGMAPDWKSACELVQTAQTARAIAAVAQNYRYFQAERTIYRALHDPAFPAYVGPVHLVTYTHNRVRPLPRTLNYPFASVWDMSCHHFDNLMYWLGPIDQMTANSWGAPWSAYEHHNNTTAHIVFQNKTRAHYIHTHDAARLSLEIQIHGERGALFRQDDTLSFSLRPTEQFGTRPVSPVPLEEAHGEADLLRDFHAYISAGIEPGISVRNNLETMAACEMMVRSITNKRTCRRRELAE
jgi:predicted dehydrogenase